MISKVCCNSSAGAMSQSSADRLSGVIAGGDHLKIPVNLRQRVLVNDEKY